MEDIIISVLFRTLVAGTPLLLATVGEVICERAGILNLGVEGVMAVGAVVAFMVTYMTGHPWLGVLAAIGAGMAISVIAKSKESGSALNASNASGLFVKAVTL